MSLEIARKVLEIEAQALRELISRLDANFGRAVDILLACHGRVVVTGLGKSGLVGQKISATFSSTGTPSFFLHPAEALHGDLGRLVRQDVVLALSYSGETEELLRLLDTVKRLAIPLLTLTGNPASTLAQSSDVVIDVGIRQEACPLGLAPTASTTAMLAMGDALAMALLEKRGFSEEDYAALHPGGGLGVRLRRVENVMHAGDEVPRARTQRGGLHDSHPRDHRPQGTRHQSPQPDGDSQDHLALGDRRGRPPRGCGPHSRFVDNPDVLKTVRGP